MREYEREMTQQSPSSSKFDYAAATGPKGLLQVQALLQFLHEHQREANLTVADARAYVSTPLSSSFHSLLLRVPQNHQAI